MKSAKHKHSTGDSSQRVREMESEYSLFYRANLGYNFRHIPTGVTITKSEFYRRFGGKQNSAWEMIPFEPVGGWKTDVEKMRHFEQVNAIKTGAKMINFMKM